MFELPLQHLTLTSHGAGWAGTEAAATSVQTGAVRTAITVAMMVDL